MNLEQIAKRLKLEILTPELSNLLSKEVHGAYVSDMLSDVLAKAPPQGILVTIQAHINVIAVAVNINLTGVIFSNGRKPEPPVVQRAIQEGILLFSSEEVAFDVVGELYQLGLRGKMA